MLGQHYLKILCLKIKACEDMLAVILLYEQYYYRNCVLPIGRDLSIIIKQLPDVRFIQHKLEMTDFAIFFHLP